MSDLLLIRHGVTAWNEARRIQGRSDPPLTGEATAWLQRRTLPPGFDACRWHSSPLTRAQTTARLLGARDLVLDEALIEMDWGCWEGRTLAEMRAEDPAAFAANEALGLDFRPPSGESPRDVRARLAAWLARISAAGEPVVAVTHKGVIRAALSLATGWDMHEDFDRRIDWRTAQHFRLAPTEAGPGLGIAALNLPLALR